MNVRQQLGLPLFEGFVPHTDPERHLKGICESILYTDLRTGFTIAQIRIDQRIEVIAGKGDPFSPGDVVEAEGVFERDARSASGQRFKAKFIKARVPETSEGIRRYLSSGVVPGIGPRSADRLWETYKEDLPKMMNSPPALMAAGLTEVRARLVVDHWNIRTRHGRLISFLCSLGIGPAMAKRLLDAYGDNVYRIILQDPYRTAREVHGIGFLTADRIALSQGTEKDSPERLRAAIHHVCGEAEREGHCAIARMGLVARTSKTLIVSDASIEAAIDRMLVGGDLIEEVISGRPVLFRSFIREAENEVAADLATRLETFPVAEDIDASILEATISIGLPPLHVGQVAAVRTSLMSRVAIITGNPGTGKTSTLSVLLKMLQRNNSSVRILLAAPTGRAAQRMTEQTGVPATTLHRLLHWSPETRKFTHNAENPLEADVLVVDESSMLDLLLFRDVLRALPKTARLYLVGDADQLPSVGAGDVLSDLIRCGAIPVSRLTHIFRQGSGSEIARESQRINRGYVPVLRPPQRGFDLWGVHVEDPKQIANEIVKMVRDRMPQEGFDPIRDVQVLAPGHKSDTGVQNLNVLLQEALNPGSLQRAHHLWKDRCFRDGDRVIQSANNYDLEVFNGDIGFITTVDADGLVVDFEGRSVRYEGAALNDLHLAYAITVHKSQGSEFPAVVLCVSTQHFMMLRRNLLYTGVSRARRLCCIVGQPKALGIGVRKGDTGRLTGLSGRLSAHVVAGGQK